MLVNQWLAGKYHDVMLSTKGSLSTMLKKEPYEFKNDQEIVKALQKQRASLEHWFTRSISDLNQVVWESVSGNTFRAFAHMPHKPSVIFRNWAEAEFRDTKDLINVLKDNSQEKYDEWTNELVDKLACHWNHMMGCSISYAASRKLTNLVVKHLILWQGLSKNDRQTLKQLAHVPFDEYALVSIRKCLNWVSIPKKPSMSFVNSFERYKNLQQYIRGLTAEAKVPPIYFDILSWNLTHPKYMDGG
ncbi:MAG: hypothetical protein COW04_03490 [Deltaproteobacteria bacterium CG12_big_fil_rev_8_21_14_0_65_43_10]|nr:MAG: hypothetical protein AUK23_07510 [Deltaproteobacteria bacterium CG2_30_43_15]PIQ46195.1 MAG: hypothetical protein COW04_03490 [Deltaproteobacteria bacterium CG12_big_fil_rev_8_21_14_0_65_43_10]PIU86002.1 MAG: hypothetical protein COS67_04860 [Deltaproteobacteria bacterium CG06_land_8_20_14_3_00_44_19]PIX22795.1 MAG: hypothetical protein COZ68_11180 [Deltaproteobacteria bacterium CG_4_8_14_3_um_filter_43_13]PIZ18892.1 MAG: hypothetical protein COY50_12910 [Deltaproteobacteria bacterium C